MTRAAALLLLAFGVGACGSGGNGSGSAPTARAGASNVEATAEEVAEEAREDLDCPARVRSATRAPGAPVDDVLGVRPGMTYEEAANIVACTHDLMVVQADNSRGFQIQTYGAQLRQGFSARFAQPRVTKSSRDYLREMSEEAAARSGNAVRQDMQPGQAKWYVATMGLPGQERVISAAREEWFAAGRNPTMASVEQALLKKYGTVTRRQQGGNQVYITWAYDPVRRPVTETSPLAGQCSGTADPDSGVNLSPDCGLVVMAMINPLQKNPQLAQFLQVGVVDQARGYELLTATEQALQQQEAQMRRKQVEEAARNADAPQL